MSVSVCSSSRSSIRSGIRDSLAGGDLAKATDRPRESRLHGAARDAERVGHLRSEEHTSELQSLMRNSYAVFCLNKKTSKQTNKQIKDTRNNTVYQCRDIT